eukprot:1157082-Pelagomonas_calceolata.AAC.1
MAFKDCSADFTDDVRHRLRGAWRAVERVDPRTTNNKLATYQAFFNSSGDSSPAHMASCHHREMGPTHLPK